MDKENIVDEFFSAPHNLIIFDLGVPTTSEESSSSSGEEVEGMDLGTEEENEGIEERFDEAFQFGPSIYLSNVLLPLLLEE